MSLILGEHCTVMINISQASGASLALSVDLRSVLNQMMHLEVWGLGPHVQEAEKLIYNLLVEVNSCAYLCCLMLYMLSL